MIAGCCPSSGRDRAQNDLGDTPDRMIRESVWGGDVERDPSEIFKKKVSKYWLRRSYVAGDPEIHSRRRCIGQIRHEVIAEDVLPNVIASSFREIRNEILA